MHILFITSALEPHGGRGPAAEVCGSLPKALKALDHPVSVLSPLYRSIDPQAHSLARRLTKIDVTIGDASHACELYTGRTVSGVTTLFLGHEDLFHSIDHVSEGDTEQVALRTQVFAAAAAQVVASLDPVVDVVHAHGAFGQAALSQLEADRWPSVLTLHGDAIESTTASVVTVGSIADAAELETRLEGTKVVGIAAGIDSATWNPLTDAHLPARFDPIDVAGKRRCKSELQRSLGLPTRSEIPLLGIQGAEGGDAGLALFVKVASQALRNDVQIAVSFGEGENGALVAAYEELWDRWPDRIQVRTGADPEFRHQLLGGADFMLAAQPESSSGAAAMKAQRYGAVPIVFGKGALGDAVVDCDAKMESGTGLVFAPFEADALLGTLQRAFSIFTQTDSFTTLRRRVMRLDHSWDRSARLYERLYASLLEEDEDEDEVEVEG